jgi:hypothetical protein
MFGLCLEPTADNGPVFGLRLEPTADNGPVFGLRLEPTADNGSVLYTQHQRVNSYENRLFRFLFHTGSVF